MVVFLPSGASLAASSCLVGLRLVFDSERVPRLLPVHVSVLLVLVHLFEEFRALVFDDVLPFEVFDLLLRSLEIIKELRHQLQRFQRVP